MSLITNTECNEFISSLRIDILNGGYQQLGKEWQKTRTLPPNYTKLYYIIGGDAFIEYGNERHPLLPGRVCLIPTDLMYDNGCASSLEMLYFNLRLTDKSGFDLLSGCPQMLELEMPIGEMRALIADYLSGEPLSHLTVKSRILASITGLLGTAREFKLGVPHYSQCVSRALEYINEHLSIKLGLEEICNNVYTARSTLSKRFADEVGVPIGTYIDNEIMTRCEQLLIGTELAIGQISERFGFCDQFYFSRRFKEKFGEPPHRYRRSKSP